MMYLSVVTILSLASAVSALEVQSHPTYHDRPERGRSSSKSYGHHDSFAPKAYGHHAPSHSMKSASNAHEYHASYDAMDSPARAHVLNQPFARAPSSPMHTQGSWFGSKAVSHHTDEASHHVQRASQAQGDRWANAQKFNSDGSISISLERKGQSQIKHQDKSTLTWHSTSLEGSKKSGASDWAYVNKHNKPTLPGDRQSTDLERSQSAFPGALVYRSPVSHAGAIEKSSTRGFPMGHGHPPMPGKNPHSMMSGSTQHELEELEDDLYNFSFLERSMYSMFGRPAHHAKPVNHAMKTPSDSLATSHSSSTKASHKEHFGEGYTYSVFPLKDMDVQGDRLTMKFEPHGESFGWKSHHETHAALSSISKPKSWWHNLEKEGLDTYSMSDRSLLTSVHGVVGLERKGMTTAVTKPWTGAAKAVNGAVGGAVDAGLTTAQGVRSAWMGPWAMPGNMWLQGAKGVNQFATGANQFALDSVEKATEWMP